MALSAAHADANGINQDEKGLRLAIRVVDAAVVYHGALLSFDTTVGLVKPYDGTETDKLAGWHFGDTVTGDTSDPEPPEASFFTGPFIWKSLTVGGLTGTPATDLGLDVFATDDGTYTITDPGSSGARIGTVVRAESSTKADVAFRNVLGHQDVFDVIPTPSPTPTPTP